MLLSRRVVCLAAALVVALCDAGIAAAQGTPNPSATQPAAPAATEAAQPAAEPATPVADDAPRKGKRAGEEEIVVTGSRIRRKDLTTPAPIAVISKQEIQASGKVSIGDFLQSLPEQGAALNTSFNNGGNGATRVALRGLGAERTLVLLNGRRFVPGGNGANSSVDLNSIPSAIIERIEVLKDGASAVYGSDAIAGVVNLITRKRIDGAELSGYAGTSTHADGTTYDFSGTAGVTGERGSLLFSGGYYTQKSVFAGDRDFSKIPYAFRAVGPTTGPFTQGSPTVPQGTMSIPACGPTTPASVLCAGRQISPPPTGGLTDQQRFYNALMQRYGTASTYIRDPQAPVCLGNPSDGNCWRPMGTLSLPPDGDGYNFQPANYLVTPQQRISLYSIGEVKFGGSVRGYFEGAYVNRQSDQKLAAEPLNTDSENLTVSGANLYNPFGRDFQFGPGTDPNFNSSFVRRRLLEFGDRKTAQDIDSFRIVAGIDGTLPEEAGPLKSWFWDVSFNYGRTVGTVIKQGNLKRSGLRDALGPTYVDSLDGQVHCGPGPIIDSPTRHREPIPGCVPLNLFGGEGTITPDQIRNLTFTGALRGTNQLVSGQFNTSGELFKLFADRPVGLAAGYEYRIVSGENIPDPITVAGDTTGNKGEITRGHYYVNEGYGELSIPVVSNVPFVQDLEATAAARVFNYSNFGGDITYKFGGRWRVIRDFTVRGTYSTGFRAPSISDLFLGQADSFPSVGDPCANPATAPSSCGPARGNGDPSVQLRTRIGGNPNLQPEKAKIYTAGIVVEPSFVRNLTVTADYYNITVDQSIPAAGIGAGVILSGCYPADDSGKAPNQQFCNLITRDPGSQRITNIINTQINVGKDETSGIDIALNYALPTEFGRFGFLLDATWLHNFDRTLADGTVIRARGSYDLAPGGGGGTFPAWKGIAGIRYGFQGLGAGINAHVIGSFRECGNAVGLFAGNGLCYQNVTYTRQIDAYSTYDLFVSYNFPSSFGRTTVSAGVNNVFDKQPLFIYNAGNSVGTSDPTAYDYMGRFGYLRLAHAF